MQRGQLFKIKTVHAEVKPELFQLEDLLKDEVKGFFYKEQLTKSSPPAKDRFFEVEEVLKTKTIKKKKWFLVKYLFYPAKFNEWIPEENFS